MNSGQSRTLGYLTVFALLVCRVAGAQLEPLASIDLTGSGYKPPVTPDGATVEIRDEPDGAVARVSWTGAEAASVSVASVPLRGVENCVIMYDAHMRSVELASAAYLELLCVFPKGGPYFSRAIEETFTGTKGWRAVSAPFLLKPGEAPQEVLLGVRFEGPGVVELRNLQLVRDVQLPSGATPGNALWGIGGAFVGLYMGIWGPVSVQLARRGKARKAVYAVTGLLAVVGIGLVLFGMEVWGPGNGTWRGYGPVLLGVILSALCGWQLWLLRSIYRGGQPRKLP